MTAPKGERRQKVGFIEGKSKKMPISFTDWHSIVLYILRI
ncbi:Uncharacterised protein [Yersinia kristensenii]|nr:Uncharacterised protein [Yersinia kristensenii]